MKCRSRTNCIDLTAFDFATVHWLPRQPQAAAHGECLLSAVKLLARLPESDGAGSVKEEAEGELLWDKATTTNGDFYGWVAQNQRSSNSFVVT
ncbi:Uncharacterised protein [Kluyvera cryocrescens]|uniref:Uncharacterized protein n=1 Tax=Kluyvera cryocrescens TaxID=580 RepID=A0A485D1Y8_KLUCR|nr:Uncharacterised protein [Kluyvera cryocrescens]